MSLYTFENWSEAINCTGHPIPTELRSREMELVAGVMRESEDKTSTLILKYLPTASPIKRVNGLETETLK